MMLQFASLLHQFFVFVLGVNILLTQMLLFLF